MSVRPPLLVSFIRSSETVTDTHIELNVVSTWEYFNATVSVVTTTVPNTRILKCSSSRTVLTIEAVP